MPRAARDLPADPGKSERQYIRSAAVHTKIAFQWMPQATQVEVLTAGLRVQIRLEERVLDFSEPAQGLTYESQRRSEVFVHQLYCEHPTKILNCLR